MSIETPFNGLGKPEALKHNLSDKWSRRLTKADSVIYQVKGEIIYIYSIKGHYE
ncbi:Txe/YoeB family addiction module toxin [Mucilaginibacter paludis]|uniref:Putative mRNA interferase YoeB n=1 Tax=Mucilaginibacter paludis DSM 18603 TaxID=714943 RepID=H1Y4B0_9SPHI|nr:Txe/YoeB family addiction module toxin [Mucilaginibacter paludis]EHQ25744.1 Addiction module toxin Txe/YoeB [Mucilaginibacter paludis DSM 18603]